MKQLKQILLKYRHAWLLSYIFLYLPWFAWLEKNVRSNYHVMHTALDDMIPFCEYFIVPYLLWFVYVAGTVLYFLFTSREDYYRTCIFLFSGMTISLIICTFFHNGTDLRPVIDPDKNVFSAITAALYRTDTSTNVFPSIHVFNSIAVHVSIRKSARLRRHTWVRLGSGLMMTAICLSTMFLKQHSVIDVAGAAVLSYIIYGFVYGYSWSAQDKKVSEKALG